MEKFDTLEEAKKELKRYKTTIKEASGNNGIFYVVTEYCIEENEYDEDDEWVAGGDVWEYSEMTIAVIEKPSYNTIATCSNFAEAEQTVENYNGDGEAYISLS